MVKHKKSFPLTGISSVVLMLSALSGLLVLRFDAQAQDVGVVTTRTRTNGGGVPSTTTTGRRELQSILPFPLSGQAQERQSVLLDSSPDGEELPSIPLVLTTKNNEEKLSSILPSKLTSTRELQVVFKPKTKKELKEAVDCWYDKNYGNDATYSHKWYKITSTCAYPNLYNNINIADWDTSDITDMSELFKGLENFNDDISSWDVSSVTTMEGMFDHAKAFNQDTSSWNVSSVTTMLSMFALAFAFNQNISSWDVSSVTTMDNMFFNATAFNLDISSWDVSSVTNMYAMFFDATAFNQTLCWNVFADGVNRGNMFAGTTAKIGNSDECTPSPPTVSPAPSWSNSPTNSPTPSPTPSPTNSPTPSPTVSSFSWKINGTEWKVGFGDDSANSEIIGTYDMTPTRDYQFDVFEEDCSTPIGDAVKVFGNAKGVVPLSGEVKVKIDIDPVKISSSSVFKDSNRDNMKNIRICVKSSLKLNDDEINFHETIMSILVDMAQDFAIQNIVTNRTEAINENKNVDSIATIDKFLCPDGDLTKPDTWNRPSDGTEPAVYKQGSIFRVCVNVTTANVSPESILQFGFNQTNGGTQGGIMMLGLDTEQLFAKGNVATSNCSGSACMIQTMIPPQYFDDLDDNRTPFNLTGSGDILLQFGSGKGTSQRRSRLLQSTTTSTMTRSLQFEGSANSAQFELPVSLEGGFNGNNIDSFEESAGTAATSRFGAVSASVLIGSVCFALM